MLPVMVAIVWAAAWLIIALRLRKPTPIPKGVLDGCWLLGLSLHGAHLLLPWLNTPLHSLDFFSALSAVAWLTSLLLFVAQLSRPLETLGLFILPFLPVVVLVATYLPHTGATIPLNTGLGLHIFASLLAYSLLALAALQATALALQNRQLHNHHPGGLIRTLPPLQDMEALLFKLVLLGLLLLTVSLASGFMYLDQLFGRQVAHKTILSSVAWLIFTILLYGHWQYGWRGKKAIRATLLGFTCLMLAFLGSKFVLEYLVTP